MSTPTEPQIYYVNNGDGSVSRIESDSGVAPTLSEPATFISEDEYTAQLAAMQQEHDDRVAAAEAAQQQAAKDDYDALIAAGIPAATARRMSGYTPPED